MPIGTWELIIIFLAVLVLFGGKKIPDIARGLGKGLREFKRAASDIQRELDLSRLDEEVAEKTPPNVPAKPKEVDSEETADKRDKSAKDASSKPEVVPDPSHDPGPEVEAEENAKEEKPAIPSQSPEKSENKKDETARDS
jgi:sec-independent protein translocase protein TatA